MAYENVNMISPNMTGDRSNAYLYSFDRIGNITVFRQYKKDSPNNPVNNTYPLDTDIGEVVCAQFDGYYYWSLERQTAGITIRKWELLSGILYLRASHSFGNTSMVSFDAYSFAVDSYSDSLGLGASSGSNYIQVVDGSKFNIGDVIVLGPSTISGYIGKYESCNVIGKSGNILYLDDGLSSFFAAGNFVYTNRYFYIFNAHALYSLNKGCLLKYKSKTGVLDSFAPSGMFKGVRASCFINDKILFVQGNSAIYINASDLGVYRYMALDNLDYDRGSTLTTYALWAYSSALYSLRSKYVFYAGSTLDYEDWAPKYNYVLSSTNPVVFFVSVKAEPDAIHAAAPGLTPTSKIKVSVLDQYLSPVVGRAVALSSTGGAVSPSTGITSSDGEFYSTYTASSASGDVVIRATIT